MFFFLIPSVSPLITITFSLSSNSQKNGVMAPTSRACVPTPMMWFSILVISANNTIKGNKLCAKFSSRFMEQKDGAEKKESAL